MPSLANVSVRVATETWMERVSGAMVATTGACST
jgi:hypothetical protein